MATAHPFGKSRWLHRGRLRDAVVILCVVSACFFPIGTTLLWVSLAVFGAGCALHVLVKGELIRNVTLCTEGAYAVVRHPYYLANYLIDISFCLLSGNVYLMLLYPFLFHWAYGPTFAEEESLLASLHGADFEAYRARVPQVFPNAMIFSSLRSLLRGFSWRRVTADEVKRVFRFGYLASLLVLVRAFATEGLPELRAGLNPLHGKRAFLLGICLALLAVSASIPRRPEGNQEAKPTGNKS